jgi:hypothetical protein
MNAIIRYLRLHCATPSARPALERDGVLAVAAIKESAELARLLLVDMGPWGRNDGASVTNAASSFVVAAHRQLISRFGIALTDTMCVELDRRGDFDLLMDMRDGTGMQRLALMSCDPRFEARSRDAFLSWAGDIGRKMLHTVDAVREGAWVGAEG